jgi:hypothetical protein
MNYAIIIIFIAISMLSYTYFYVFKDNMILRSYYSVQYQLFNVYSNNISYYNIFYNIFFIAIIVIISTVLYWDTVYKTAKKTSSCHEIARIIEEGSFKKDPFLYTIIVFNNDKIDKSISKYFLKIVYDFKKMKTTVDSGNDDGSDNALIAYNTRDTMDSAQKLAKELNAHTDKPQAPVYTKSLVYKNYYYFDLRAMKSAYIADINTDVLNSDIYTYIAIGPDNKVIKNYTANALLKFTKEFSMNENYNTSIINDIIFAKKNVDKLSL